MPVHHSLPRMRKRNQIQFAFNGEKRLLEIGAGIRRIDRVEQHALLHWGQLVEIFQILQLAFACIALECHYLLPCDPRASSRQSFNFATNSATCGSSRIDVWVPGTMCTSKPPAASLRHARRLSSKSRFASRARN